MAGSHRAPRASKPRTGQGRSAVPAWALTVAVVAALVPALVLGTHRLLDNGDAPTTHRTELPIPPVSPTTSATASPPAPTPSQSSAPPVALPRVAPAPPRRITSHGLIDSGFDSAVTAIEPASRSEVARWESRGSPGSPGTDTVYLVGEVHGQGSAFDGLPRLAEGATVSIRTDNGTLTYTVSATTLESADALGQSAVFKRHKPGRLVLVGVRYDDAGGRLDKALVVTAQLSGAKRS